MLRLMTLLFALLFAGCQSERYTSQNVGSGVSASMETYEGADLSQDLDVSKLPAMISECYKEGLEAKKQKEDLQKYVVQRLAEKVKQISTVDLNKDGNADPVFIIPEGDDEQMTFSVRVPNPAEVTAYPELSDKEAWQKIADEQSVEIASVTAVPRAGADQKISKIDIEAKPSSSFYNSAPNYHSSFASDLLTYMIIRDLFFRPMWWGPGSFAPMSPMGVGQVANQRQSTVTKYSSSPSSYNSIKTDSGRVPTKSKSSEMASAKSFSVAKDMRASSVSSGGFGRSSAGDSTSRSGGFGRSATGSSSGGFGRSSSSSSSRGWFSGSSSRGGSRIGK